MSSVSASLFSVSVPRQMSDLAEPPADFLRGVCGLSPVAGAIRSCQTKIAGGAGSLTPAGVMNWTLSTSLGWYF